MWRLICAFALVVTLAACGGGGERGPIPVERLDGVAFRAPDAPKLTLITVINNRTGSGGHSALMVSGSQRVIFDPAGSFRPDWVAEYGDVLYGITPRNLQAYRSAHARSSHHVVTQEFAVSAEVAERALQLVQANGTVPSAFCANSTSSILQNLAGFEDVDVTFFPDRLMDQMATRSGVLTERYYEDDAGKVVDGFSKTLPAASE